MAKRFSKCGLVLLAAVVLAGGSCAKRQKADAVKWDAEVKAANGPVEVKVRVNKKEITLADTFTVELEATAQDGYEVTMPKAETLMKDFGLRDWKDEGKRLDDKGRVVRTVQCELDPIVSGKYEIPAVEFSFRKTAASDPNEAAKTYTVTTEPIEVEVISLLAKDPNWKPEIADIEPVMEMPRQYGNLWWWVGGCAVVAIAAGAWLMLRKKNGKGFAAVMIPAHELAYQRLRDLVAEDLVTQGMIKEFYERISNILRHYIEDRFDLRAPEQTTEEFLFELSSTSALEGADKERLKEFMTHCDLVKFAKFQPDAAQIQRTFDLVKQFIEKTRSDLKVIEQPQGAADQEEA
jgi:hypothetical protein